ncbi:hypothetical protein EV363DRAFT_1448095 [Boletus edulis]|nr:hypothetical protein EV363DRAFT_1448095 [Boletus edulis]
MMLHDHLNKLPSPSVNVGRLRLGGIVFPVTGLVYISTVDIDPDICVYRATTTVLGDVETKTTDDLSGIEVFVFIHPWITDQQSPSRYHTRTAPHRSSQAAIWCIITQIAFTGTVYEETSSIELMHGIGTVDIQ